MTSSAARRKLHSEPGEMREFGARIFVAQANISITDAPQIEELRQHDAEGADEVVAEFSLDPTADRRVDAVGAIYIELGVNDFSNRGRY
tara:strand:- start:814 stop:1080 length:267 start_codon:yes stop_codon:yes gene_type:complete